jgi:hypothetical protein
VIKEQELLDAIAECQGERNPNANTCRNLAAFYTILDHMNGNNTISEPMPKLDEGYSYDSGSDFYLAIRQKSMDEILGLFDEVMETLQVVNPRLYASIMRKI